MARIACAHESDVIMFVATGRWPDRAPTELRAHADQCEVCGPLGMAALAIDTEAAAAPPALPSAGTVWWRAQLRARQDAARQVVRPITVAQALGIAAAFGVAGAVFGATASWFQGSLRSLWHTAGSMVSGVQLPALPSLSETLATVGPGYWALLAGVLVSLLAAAAIVGWAMKEE